MACGVLLSDTCWGGVVGLSAIEFKAHITAGTFDVGVTSKAPTQGEPFIREARTCPFNGTQEQRGVYTMKEVCKTCGQPPCGCGDARLGKHHREAWYEDHPFISATDGGEGDDT